eukprot:scaffold22.g6142.t1
MAVAVADKGPTGAEKLLRAAVKAGVEACFANPGTSEMHFVSALDSVGGMRAVLGLHETVCTGAADGYGRMAGKPALTLLHLGPGLANGLSNLHNARRAGAPVVNLVGDMATWHRTADPLLHMGGGGIEALAATASKSVATCRTGDDLAAAMAEAAAHTQRAAAIGGSRVATIIVPHDLSWERSASDGSPSAAAGAGQAGIANGSANCRLDAGAATFVRDCAAALKACPRGKAALYIGGRAALADDGALQDCGRVAAATGAALLCENAFARVDRGAGLPNLQRLPYFPQAAAAALAAFQLLVLVDMLCTEVGGSGIAPGVNCGGAFCAARRPPLPTGRLTAAALCQAVAALQPPGAIIGALAALAREQLHVVTVVEMAKQRISPTGGPAARALTELGRPAPDWAALAAGFGVPTGRATSCEELCEQLSAALARPGPSLIEAVL